MKTNYYLMNFNIFEFGLKEDRSFFINSRPVGEVKAQRLEDLKPFYDAIMSQFPPTRERSVTIRITHTDTDVSILADKTIEGGSTDADFLFK